MYQPHSLTLLNRFASVVLPLFLVAPLYSSKLLADDWKIVRNEQGIKVSLREVSNSDYKMFRGEAVISAQVDAVMSALIHSDSCNLWRYRCSMFISLGDDYKYLVNDLPWPLRDRFVIIRNIQKERTTLDITHVPLTKLSTEISKQLPDHNGLVEMKEYIGYWKVEDLDNSKVNVIFQMQINPAGSVPATLVNSGVVNNPFNTLLNLRKYVESIPQDK